jgi:uncharacterized OsmC-like protein
MMSGVTDGREETTMETRVPSERDSPKPIIRRKTVTAHNDGGMRTEIDVGEYGRIVTDEPVAHGGTGEGPSPLQTVVGALCGCESVTFSRTAAEMGLEYRGIDFAAEFRLDIRGRLGNRDVRPYFHTVRVEARVDTDATDEQLHAVIDETERRCPVFNLLSDAGVELEMRWLRRAT